MAGSGSGRPRAPNRRFFNYKCNRKWSDPAPAGQGPQITVFSIKDVIENGRVRLLPARGPKSPFSKLEM